MQHLQSTTAHRSLSLHRTAINPAHLPGLRLILIRHTLLQLLAYLRQRSILIGRILRQIIQAPVSQHNLLQLLVRLLLALINNPALEPQIMKTAVQHEQLHKRTHTQLPGFQNLVAVVHPGIKPPLRLIHPESDKIPILILNPIQVIEPPFLTLNHSPQLRMHLLKLHACKAPTHIP